MVMLNNVNASDKRRSESGNVLFLILIAVALFAALSYAVTQSTRSGGGDASSETNLVNSSQITQYPASIKTAITRMNVSNSIAVDELLFEDPSLFAALSTDTLKGQGVFHPIGGGATYQLPPNNVMASGTGQWIFTSDNQVLNIGTDGNSGNDVIAFLPNIKKAICDKINSQLGISGTIAETAVVLKGVADLMDTSHPGISGTAGPIIGTGATALVGKPQGCFSLTGTPVTYHYYSVLIER